MVGFAVAGPARKEERLLARRCYGGRALPVEAAVFVLRFVLLATRTPVLRAMVVRGATRRSWHFAVLCSDVSMNGRHVFRLCVCFFLRGVHAREACGVGEEERADGADIYNRTKMAW